LFYSPLLILACISLIRISGEEALRRSVRLAVVISGIILISGHGAAHGGWAAGPRYILFVVPFLIEPLIETNWFELRPGLAGLLLGASICLSVLPALCFPFVPHEFSFPHNTFWRPLLAGEGWAAPTLGALAGLGAGLPALVPVVLALGCALAISLRHAPRRLIAGLLAGFLLVGLYCFLPGLDNVDLALGRAVIAERFFRPQGRLESFRALATDPVQLRSLDDLRWMVADARAFAPGNWPYSNEPLPKEAPSSIQPRVRALQEQGKLGEAVQLYRAAREEYPFAKCKFTDQMAVALYLSGDRGKALEELESARPLVSGNPSADCCLVLFHLGNLYSEQHRTADALSAFQAYLQATEGDESAVSVRSRKEAAAQAQRLASQ
jgi:hypothetical protein